ncbi:LacI family DNA-binding transcriptional regulator [Sediminibacillus massiliensis]|uniref:LacI family DNA-binding transcriptional regulator n=1 Tax=Sediminibacillus massiliensis TaxID=1926277 RepID=UPI00098870DE|nr:LacI family DNA-binding transcriptional regulator [Sediminibacillus massiliensis]
MNVTIKDIAAAAGVSYSTVSKALNDSPLVKPDTKNKIVKLAKELGYRPNFAAQRLVSKQTKTIGLVWPSIDRVALSMLVSKINEKISHTTYSILLSINDVKSALEMFQRFQVDGLIVFEEDDASSQEIGGTHLPVVSYGTSTESYPVITPGYKESMELAVNYLNKMGHRQIALIGDFTHDNRQMQKREGFRAAMEKAGLKVTPDQLIHTNGLHWYDGYSAAVQLLDFPERPTALIGSSYEISSGVVRAVREKNLSIPKDLSVISYDHIPQMANLEVPLTSVGIPIDTLAKAIVDTVIVLIEKGETDTVEFQPAPEIMERASCSYPRYSIPE